MTLLASLATTVPVVTVPGAPEQAAQLVQQAAVGAATITPIAETSQDPVVKTLVWGAGVLLMVLAMARPFMALMRQWKVDKANSAADDANISTFERQTKQIDRLIEKVEKLEKEREELYAETVQLRTRVERLEEVELNLKKLREKLLEKDLTIGELRKSIKERDDKIMALMEELVKTNRRVHDLELRLAKDEQKQCLNCGASFNSVGDNLPRI